MDIDGLTQLPRKHRLPLLVNKIVDWQKTHRNPKCKMQRNWYSNWYNSAPYPCHHRHRLDFSLAPFPATLEECVRQGQTIKLYYPFVAAAHNSRIDRVFVFTMGSAIIGSVQCHQHDVVLYSINIAKCCLSSCHKMQLCKNVQMTLSSAALPSIHSANRGLLWITHTSSQSN